MTRVRLTDTRLLIIFVLLVVILGGGATYVVTSLQAINANCVGNRANTQAFNRFIGQLQMTTATSKLLTHEDRVQRVAFYQQGKQPVPRCPTPPGGVRKPKVDPPPPPPYVP